WRGRVRERGVLFPLPPGGGGLGRGGAEYLEGGVGAMSIANKHVVFCGANSGSPSRDSHLWSPRTTMGKIVERALTPLGYEVDIDPRGFGMANPRLVSAGEADLGAIGGDQAWWAYEGKYDFEGEARRNLRVIASIHFPAWLGV